MTVFLLGWNAMPQSPGIETRVDPGLSLPGCADLT
jgi:hypothetical protein